MRLLLCLSLFLGAVSFAAAPLPRVSPAVLKLSDQLGDEDEDTQKGATKKLEALGESVLTALRAAVRNHRDADVRLRATVLIKSIERNVYVEIRRLVGHKKAVINFA